MKRASSTVCQTSPANGGRRWQEEVATPHKSRMGRVGSRTGPALSAGVDPFSYIETKVIRHTSAPNLPFYSVPSVSRGWDRKPASDRSVSSLP